jgi:hypothetical protein
VIEAQVDMPIVGAISLHISLLTVTLGVHPDRLDYVDQVLVCCFSNTEASSSSITFTLRADAPHFLCCVACCSVFFCLKLNLLGVVFHCLAVL